MSGTGFAKQNRFTGRYDGYGLFLIFFTIVFTSKAVYAKPATPPAELSVWWETLSETNIKHERGTLSYQTAGVTFDHPLGGFRFARTYLDWSNPHQLSIGDGIHAPVKEVNHVRLTGKYPVLLTPTRVWINQFSLVMDYESNTNDALGVNVTSFVHQSLTPDWSVAYGGFVHYHPVRTRFYPFAGASYRTKTYQGFSAFVGFPKTSMSYGFDSHWQVSAGVLFHQFMFKLDKDSTLQPDGYGEIESWQGDATLQYRYTSDWSLKTSVRWSSAHRFIVYSADKSREHSYTLTPGLGARILLEKRF